MQEQAKRILLTMVVLLAFAAAFLALHHGLRNRATYNSTSVAREQQKSSQADATANVPRPDNQQSSSALKPSNPVLPQAQHPSEQKPESDKPKSADAAPPTSGSRRAIAEQRFLTEDQKTGLVALAESIPKEFTVVVASGDAREQKNYAKEIEHAFSGHIKSRQVVFVDYHARGMFLAVKSADDAAYSYAIQLAQGMSDIGFPVVGLGQNERISPGEIDVLVGAP